MRIRIVSDVMRDEYDGQAVNADLAEAYIAGCEPYIVPGVISWDNVETEDRRGDRDRRQVVVSADLETLPVIPDGEFKGQKVSAAWINGYITGADSYWLAPDVLRPVEISFS